MASPRPPSLAQATHYRLPELLHDIRLLDLLQLSQPTISRRYRIQAEDFGLVRDRRPACGGNSLQTPDDWIRRIHGSALALVVADREAHTWASLRRGPLASRPHRPGAGAEGMRSVHRSETQASQCFWCAAASLPLAAVSPRQALQR